MLLFLLRIYQSSLAESFTIPGVRIRIDSEIPNDELESQDKLDPIGSDGLSSVRNDVSKF